MVLPEAMENQERIFSVTCLDVVQEIPPVVDVAFLDHWIVTVWGKVGPANDTQNLSFRKIIRILSRHCN